MPFSRIFRRSDEETDHTSLALPAVRGLTRDGRLSTYDESVLKLSKVSFPGKCACMGHPLKLPSPTQLARLGHFPPASQAGRLASPVFYFYIFSLGQTLWYSTVDTLCLLGIIV